MDLVGEHDPDRLATVVVAAVSGEAVAVADPAPLLLPFAPETSLRDTVDYLEHRAAVVVLPVPRSGAPDPSHDALRTAAVALAGRCTLVIHAVALPPLGVAAVAGLAGALAPHAPSPAALSGALRMLEDGLVVGAVLRSVARLREPSPRLADRVRSLIPASRFLALLRPGPALLPMASGGDGSAFSEGIAVAAVAGEGPDLDDAVELVQAGTAVAVELHDAHPEASAWWSGRAPVELAAVPAASIEHGRALLAGAGARCPWCDEVVLTRPCPGCGHALNRAVAA